MYLDKPDDTPEGQALAVDYARTFTTDHGQRVFADLGRFCNFGGEMFSPDGNGQTEYNAGRVRPFLRILAMMDKAPADALALIKRGPEVERQKTAEG